MKKYLKKLTKKLYKKSDALKDHLKAQGFYVKKFAKESGKSILFIGKWSAISLLVMVSSVGAGRAHLSYIEHKVGSQVVYIQSPVDSKVHGSGTAFEVKTPSGKVVTVTNAHVCGLANDKGYVLIEEKRFSGRMIPKRVIEVYTENDLCIVEGLDGYAGLSVGDERSVGEWVYALGFPMGGPMDVSYGRIKAFSPIYLMSEKAPEQCTGKNEHVESINFLFFTVPVCFKAFDSVATNMSIYPGNSGSPMVDLWGNVVGVVFASNRDTNWGYSVPVKYLKDFLSAY